MGEAHFDEQPSVLQKLQKWGDYDAFGEPVAPTKFIPMKTPLSREIIEHWDGDRPPKHPLTLDILVNAQASKGRRLGMIIDLSNHETLYSADLARHNIRYERVPLIAKILPTQQAMNKVIEIADKFWSDHPDEFIGIHCAYGFNRTGFSLCSYMIQACHMSVQEALDSFAAARPPGVRHEQFVEELHKRYDGNRRNSEALPFSESFSDLRGFSRQNKDSLKSRQTIDSLRSEFAPVAEHLTNQHPGDVGREAVLFTRASPEAGGWSCTPIREDTPDGASNLSSNILHTHSMSGKSLDAPLSHCESINNESLDLDERDIFKHFACRTPRINVPTVHGRHRRARLSNMHPPEPVGEEETASSYSSSLGKPGRSPFSTVQDSEEMFHISAIADPCARPADSCTSAATEIDLNLESIRQQQGNSAVSSSSTSTVAGDDKNAYLRPPLYPNPISARLSLKDISGDPSCQPNGQSYLAASQRGPECQEKSHACIIM